MKKIIIPILIAILVAMICGFCFDIYKQEMGERNETIIDNQSSWQGDWVWVKSASFSNKDVSISNETAKSFDFDLSAIWQANPGEIKGTATISHGGQYANWTDTDPTNNDDGTFCTVSFVKNNDEITINLNHCSNYGGQNVFGDPDDNEIYKKDFVVPDENILTDSRTVFSNATPEQKNAFSSLVGEKISLFNNSSGLCNTVFLNDIHASKSDCFVSGVAPWSANIIIIGLNNQIWAAVLDSNETSTKIDYFTNVPTSKNKIPDAVRAWNTWNYPIVYN